jgi:hypothetical protein
MAESAAVLSGGVRESVGVVVIHGVGETEPGWIDDYFVPNLQTADPGFAPEMHGRVIKLPEPAELVGNNSKFTVRLRDGRLDGGADVHLIELFWADLSRSGSGKLVDTLASLRLFFEAPHVTARAMLSEELSGLDRVLRKLILLAIGLLRGPVTGLNICFLAVAFALVYYERIPVLKAVPIFYMAAGTLAALVIASAALYFWLRNRDTIWADLSKATSWVGAGLLLVFITAPLHGALDDLQTPLRYFWAFRPILLGVWIVWACVLMSAIVLLLLRNIFDRSPDKRAARHRLSAALAVAIAQCGFWLTVLPILGVIIIDAAVNDSRDASYQIKWGRIFHQSEIISLSEAAKETSLSLWLTFTFDILCISLVIVVVGAILTLRHLLVAWHGTNLDRLRDRLPRLIVNSTIVWAIVLGGLILAPIEIFRAQMDVPKKTWLIALAPYAVIVLYAGRFLWNLVHARAAIALHVARDLVDHHTSRADQLGRRLSGATEARKAGAVKPKRLRIQRRLESTLVHLAEVVNPTRVLFVAHSQGTMILLEFFRDGQSVRRLFPDARIDILTLGSPITHLYGHYFHEYDNIDAMVVAASSVASSWHNMYRVDDPIAHRVASSRPEFPTNEALPKGGHTDYWAEKLVCAKVMAMIRNQGAGQRDT